jgi:hypothetical protein
MPRPQFEVLGWSFGFALYLFCCLLEELITRLLTSITSVHRPHMFDGPKESPPSVVTPGGSWRYGQSVNWNLCMRCHSLLILTSPPARNRTQSRDEKDETRLVLVEEQVYVQIMTAEA